jgi:hypothetical protein
MKRDRQIDLESRLWQMEGSLLERRDTQTSHFRVAAHGWLPWRLAGWWWLVNESFSDVPKLYLACTRLRLI